MKKFKIGDKIVVSCVRDDLFDIGVNSDDNIAWLLNGNPKEVKEVQSQRIFLEKEDGCSLWVYGSMAYKVR